MKIGLIDVDGHHFPNLPLMKLSAFHKSVGNTVEWYNPEEYYDIVYQSKVFSFTPDIDYPVNAKTVIRGGSGYAIHLEEGKEVYEDDVALPSQVEHIYPDYSLYPDLTEDTAYGFLTRGCPRGCGFCHVEAKEGKRSIKVADLTEFWSGQKNIVLCDPNMLACREHESLLEQLIESKAKIDFNQGLDIRLITESNLNLLNQIRLKHIHFAFDRWQDRKLIEGNLRKFKEITGYNRNKVMVYILVNYDTTIEQDIYRIQLCRELNFSPYPMIYNKTHCDQIYKKLQRWCNNFIFWKTPTFEEYVHGRVNK